MNALGFQEKTSLFCRSLWGCSTEYLGAGWGEQGVGRGQTEHNVFDLPSLKVSCILACPVHFRRLSLVTVNPGKT